MKDEKTSKPRPGIDWADDKTICALRFAIYNCHIGVWHPCWYTDGMKANRKITVHIPEDLLRKAEDATGHGVTATVRRGLELVAAGRACEKLRGLKGKVKFSARLDKLREDRR